MDDPLILLRAAISAPDPKPSITYFGAEGELVTELSNATHISLPRMHPVDGEERIMVPKNAPTRFSMNDIDKDPTSPQDGPDKYYNVGCLLFAYLRRNDNVGEYLNQAVIHVGSFVSVVDRRLVVDYLEGAGDVPKRIYPLDGQVKADIDQPGTAATGDSAASRPAKRPRYVPDKSDQDAVKKLMSLQEPYLYQLSDRNRVLRGAKARNFKPFLDSVISDKLKEAREELKNGGAAKLAEQAKAQGKGGVKKRKPIHPIIIVSPSSSAIVTMFNVKRFLEEGIYEPNDIARAKFGSGRQAEEFIVVNHKRQATGNESINEKDDRIARYYVVDGADALEKFGDDAWDRVVCVMTTGQEWQFRPYRWSEPKDLFRHVKGIYFQWANDPPNKKLVNWNVNSLKVDPEKRHIDKSTVASFWQAVEQWIMANKPWMRI